MVNILTSSFKLITEDQLCTKLFYNHAHFNIIFNIKDLLSKNKESNGVGEYRKNGLNFLHKEVREINIFSIICTLLTRFKTKS
jgi:hypothetical protein